MYFLFSQTLINDRQFWWELSIEEKNHSSLIESEKLFYKVNAFPEGLFDTDLEELVKINKTFSTKIELFKHNQTKENAFAIALEMENLAIEMNFQKLVENDSMDRAISLFKQLNRADKDHAKRILEYKSKTDYTKN